MASSTIMSLLKIESGEHSLTKPLRAKVSALGTYTPPRLLTNADLEKMVATSDEWITERTGIRQRHIVDKGVATSHLAVEAVQKALAERGIAGADVEAIFLARLTPDMMFPATACLVKDRIGAGRCGKHHVRSHRGKKYGLDVS